MTILDHPDPPPFHWAEQTVEDELERLVAGLTSQRNERMFMRYQGWDGGGQRPLRIVAEEFGITSERVRQVCQGVRASLRHRGGPSPILDRTLEYVASHVPMDARVIEARLVEAHMTKSGFTLDLLQDAARMLGRRVPFVLETFHEEVLALPVGTGGVTAIVLRAAKRCSRRLGAATVEHVAAAILGDVHIAIGVDLTFQVLRACPSVEWLDKTQGWFWLRPTSKNRMVRQIRKVLLVAGRISISELNLALMRGRRRRRFSPPEAILREICRRLPGCRLDGDEAVGDPQLCRSAALTGVEEKLVQVLQDHGPVLPNGRFRELCLAAGIKPKTFDVYRKYSAVVKEHPGRLYGLSGLS